MSYIPPVRPSRELPKPPDLTKLDKAVSNHILKVHGGAAIMHCPFCRHHVFGVGQRENQNG